MWISFEKSCILGLRKRLRKRFSHYSLSLIRSQLHFSQPQPLGAYLDTAAATLEHVERLAVRIGNRPIGSAANLAAAEYIAGVFSQSGLSVETQNFPCPDWIEEQTALELDGMPLEAFANTF